MSKIVDLTGQRFGRLTVLEITNKKKYGKILWHCKCDCGNTKEATNSSLKCGDVKSCGCLQKDTRRINAKNIKTKTKHGMCEKRLYRIYHNMISRCYRKCTNGYENYGGRGIKVCEQWLGEKGFINFMNWSLSNGYNDELTIDRIDSNGNYEPNNCRWATRKDQCNNRRNNIILEYKDKKYSVSKWSEITGIKKTVIYQRLRKGFSVGKALGYE